MSDTVIKVENLSKKYLIGHQRTERYQTFRDTLAAQVKGWGRRLTHPFRNSAGGLVAADEIEEFYALRDVSFEIRQGDRVGIIGRNGAGKSTLLKILSRITEPTSGRIEIAGRVASLLEVGTGFHPELTGRENIFLNGAILGMARVEIKRKFDEIVAFAEVEKFLDTPVKRYSSGMYVRLAFAVAAHLEPEILIVDEVLAVGDVQFQKKCLGKMEEAGKDGRTILFVSHNIKAIKRLCSNGLLLKNGHIECQGNVDDIIWQYLDKGSVIYLDNLSEITDRKGSGLVKFTSVLVREYFNKNKNIHVADSAEIIVEISKECDDVLHNISLSIDIDNNENERIFTLWSKYINKKFTMSSKKMKLQCVLHDFRLKSGRYYLNLYADVDGVVSDYLYEKVSVDILYEKYYESGLEPSVSHGDVMAKYEWHQKEI